MNELPWQKIVPAGDAAVLIDFGNSLDPELNRSVQRMACAVRKADIIGVWGTVPAFTTLLVEFDPAVIDQVELIDRISGLHVPPSNNKARVFEIPVAYGGSFGEDLCEYANHLGLSENEVISLHSSSRYRIYCIGFSPGFPLCGVLPDALRAPRRASPRTRVPPGSVACAGLQTGVYPTLSPGGWNLIGRTPAQLFDLNREPPVTYRPGDFLSFRPIDKDEFTHLQREQELGSEIVREVSNLGGD